MLALLIPAALTFGQPPSSAPTPAADPFAKWEKNVAAIEERLKKTPPPAGPVVFAGSSSIVRWDLAKAFPGKPAVNVGFGGSKIADCTHFAPRLVAPLKPAAVVFYAGDNDIGGGRSPEQVRDDFQAFVAAVRKAAPDAKIWFIPVKPSLARWKLYDTQTKANALVKAMAEVDPRLGYIDIVPAMLGADGKPVPEHFVKDGLHMTPEGYAVWNAAVAKALGW